MYFIISLKLNGKEIAVVLYIFCIMSLLSALTAPIECDRGTAQNTF